MLTPEREAEIRQLCNGEWADTLGDLSEEAWEALDAEWAEKTREFATTCENAEELAYFIEMANWDSEREAIELILTNPNCDLAAALLAYWMMQPGYYSGFATLSAVPDFQRDDAQVLKDLAERLTAGAYADKGTEIRYREYYAEFQAAVDAPTPDPQAERDRLVAMGVDPDGPTASFYAGPKKPNPSSEFYPSETILSPTRERL